MLGRPKLNKNYWNQLVCEKCGKRNVLALFEIRYCASGMGDLCWPRGGEHMHITCNRCHFEWVEEVLDSKK